jgi:hypothetical protein
METFDFFLDQKVSTWMRTEFSIEADNLNDAVKIAKEKLERGDIDEISWEEVDDTKEILLPCDNDNQSTAEMYYMNDKGDVMEVYNNKVDKVENI